MTTRFNIPYEFSKEAALESIAAVAESNRTGYICVADGNILQMVHRDLDYRNVVNGSLFTICDSSWVPLFIKLIYGEKVSQYCGSQIFNDIISSRRYRMYFLGSRATILIPLKYNLSERFDPRISDMVFEELPFLSVDEFDYKAIAAKINKDNPDIIWVSLGAPKQEIFMSRLMPYLNRGVMIAVGAAFKFYSGVGEKRAPEWMIKTHLEFLFRIFQDPRKQIYRCWMIISTLPYILFKEIKKKHNK